MADKRPDACPAHRVLRAVLDADWTQIQGLIQKLVVRGDPEGRISAIEEVETVFQNGVGYDLDRWRESTRGMVGAR